MPRKNPVRWTQHEETLIAREVERIRENPEARENRAGGGQLARSLASQVIIAQRVLPVVRRKTGGGIHTMRDLPGWFAAALARSATYGLDAPAKTDAAPLDPETARRNDLADLAGRFLQLVEQAVASGIAQALAQLPQQHAAPAPVLIPAHAVTPPQPAAPKRRIDIVGLKGNQCEAVLHSDVAQAFEIRFLKSDCHLRKRELGGEVILMRKFIQHTDQERFRMMGAAMHWANGGVTSVIRKLEELRNDPARRGNGSGMH